MFGHKGFVHLNKLIEGYTAPQPTGTDQGMAQRCENLAGNVGDWVPVLRDFLVVVGQNYKHETVELKKFYLVSYPLPKPEAETNPTPALVRR
jgi:hypothetical protein